LQEVSISNKLIFRCLAFACSMATVFR